MPKKKKKSTDEQRKLYEKTMDRPIPKREGSLALMVTEDTYDKALTAFNIAVAAKELGMDVTMYFTSRGVNVLTRSYKPRRARWGEAPIGWKETMIKTRGGSLLGQMMYQARDMGVRICVCYTSMVSTSLNESHIIDGIEVLRMAEFLDIAMRSDAHIVIG